MTEMGTIRFLLSALIIAYILSSIQFEDTVLRPGSKEDGGRGLRIKAQHAGSLLSQPPLPDNNPPAAKTKKKRRKKTGGASYLADGRVDGQEGAEPADGWTAAAGSRPSDEGDDDVEEEEAVEEGNVEGEEQQPEPGLDATVDPDGRPWCGAEGLYAEGRWEVVEDEVELPYDMSVIDPTYSPECSEHSQRRMRLQWSPSSCSLRPFSAEGFCRALAGRGVMFIGDSISASQASSLYNLLRGPSDYMVGYSDMEHCEEDPRLRSPHCQGLRVCTDVYPETNGVPLVLLRVLHLDEQWFEVGLQSWKDYGLLVLNFGAHAHKAGITPDDFQKTLETRVVPFVRRMVSEQNKTVVYRSANEGHSMYPSGSYCFEGKYGEGPMTEEEWRQWQPPTVHGWDQFQHFNDAARRAMAQAGGVYMDVRRLSVTYKTGMPGSYIDGFGDCLHHCLPGLPDTWNQVLYGVIGREAWLQQQREEEEEARRWKQQQEEEEQERRRRREERKKRRRKSKKGAGKRALSKSVA